MIEYLSLKCAVATSEEEEAREVFASDSRRILREAPALASLPRHCGAALKTFTTTSSRSLDPLLLLLPLMLLLLLPLLFPPPSQHHTPGILRLPRGWLIALAFDGFKVEELGSI